MTQQFQGFLKHRRITFQEKLGFDNVHIFKPCSSSSFVNLLKLGLDNLYLERLLENGTCTVCCEATSKFCSICGTNYCSVNCQTRDWERHQLVCENTLSSASTSSINCNDNSNENISHTNVIPSQQSEDNEVSLLEDSLKGSAKIKPNDRKTKPSEELYSSKTVDTANKKDECSKDLPFKNICKETESNKVLSKKIKSKNWSSKNMKSAASESDVFCIPAKFERFKIGHSYKIKFLSWVEKRVMCYVIPVESQNMLHDLKTKFQSSYHNYERVKNVVAGETYLAFVNKEWCRVKVKNLYPDMKNGSKRINARKIDMGDYCSPAIEEMRELPPEIKTLKPLATMVKFVAHIKAFDECSVDVVGFERNGVPIVAVKNASQSSTESILSTGNSEKTVKHIPSKCPSIEEINSNKSKTTQSKKSTDEILNKKKLEHQSYRSSIVSELKDKMVGFFHCVKTDKHLIYGYLVPGNNETATDSMRRKSNLDGLPLEQIIARPGDLVMVQADSGRYSGRVEKKTWGTYSVYLLDCNYSINTKKVYKLDKSCYNTIDLGCHIILDHETIIKHKITVNEKKYPIYVSTQKSDHSWCCKIRIMNFDLSGTIMGALTPCECFIPMQSGCSVIITSVGEVRKLGDGAEIMLHVQLASKKWQSFFQEYYNSFRKTIANECDTSFHKGELVFAKSTHWHRAEVLDYVKNQIKVRFVDIGNEKLLQLNGVRKMPKQFKNMPFFSRMVRVRLSKNFTKEIDWFNALMEKKTTLTMTYDSEMGINVKLSASASSETEIESWDSDNGNESPTCEKKEIDKKVMSLEINLSCLSVGPIPCFTVLHVEEEEFESEGVFWGANVDSEHFKYVADDLGKEITQYCKSSKDTEYHPEIGEFCLAIYEDEWYRGLVVNKFDQRFEVFFIDFGNKSLVGPKKIRKKNSHFFSKEPLAARCVLSGFNTMTAKERESALEYLNLKMNERLSVFVEKVINYVNYINIPEVAKY